MSTVTPLYRQLVRVSRRLFLQTLMNCAAWCWTGALALAAIWFVLQPFVLESSPDWLRWAVAGGLLGLASALAVGLAFLRSPSKLAAALSLDEKFGLKERVTTTLTLAPEDEASPAGQALLADVNQRIAQLNVGSRFPVRMTWTSALVPAGVAILALVTLFPPFEPAKSAARPTTVDESKQPPKNAAQIDEKVNALKKRIERKPGEKEVKSEKLKEIEAKLERIASQPRDTKEQVRERIKEMTALEQFMKNQEKDLAARNAALGKQLKQMEQMAAKDLKEGPAKDLQKALSEGKLDKAQEELERLAKKIKNNELTDKEKEQLKRQLQDLKEKIQRTAEQKDKEEQLKKLQKEGKIDAETLQREMDKLKQECKNCQSMQKLAEKLGKCQKGMQDGNSEQAMEGLKEAGDQLKDMDMQDQELESLREQLQRLQDAKDSCCQGMEKGQPGRIDDIENGNPVPAEGRRPVGDKTGIKSIDARQRAELNKGKLIHEGFAPGQNFKQKTGPELSGEIKQAAQEAPDAIEQQRIPKAARDMAKNYFKNLGDQKEAPAKPPEKAPEKAPEKR